MKKLFSGMVLLGMMGSAPVWAAGSDELWEMTMKMDMPGMGMAMPAMTNTSCLPKGGAYKPDNEQRDKNCEMTDVQVSGNTTKWKMRCTGKDPVEGSGEVTRTADTMNGKIKMSMKGGQMTQVISGKRVGTCDAATEIKRMEEAALAPMKEANEKQRAECRKLLDGSIKTLVKGYASFVYQGSPCLDMKNSMCDKVRAQSGDYSVYNELAAQEKDAVKLRKQIGASHVQRPLAAECGLDMDKLERGICQKANGDRKYGFLAANCPAEAQTLAKRHCEAWGRDYTSDHDNEYAPICSKYSKNKSSYEGGDELVDEEDSGSSSGNTGKSKASARKEEKSSAGDNPVGAVLDGAKKLKGLFNF